MRINDQTLEGFKLMSTPVPNDAARVIRALDAEFARHANAGDAAALTDAFYAEGAHLLPPNTPQVTGRAAIRDFWKAFMSAGVKDVVLDTAEIYASGDLAYGVGKYSYSQGGAKHTGKYSVVYRRQANGGFQAVVDSFNSNE
jgi:ketosteroid isomerase-like protein